MTFLRSKPHLFLVVFVIFLPFHSFSRNQEQKEYGDILVIGDFGKPSPINPIITRSTISATLKDIIFEGLTKLDQSLNVEPNIAFSWNHSADGLKWTFHLRKNIKFHDGVELTAEDVKFTFDKILDPRNDSPYLNLLKNIKEVETKNRYQVEFELNYPIASLLFYLDVGILPKHHFNGKDITKDEFNYHPIGTGPFKLANWTENEIVLEAHKQYFLGRPYLEKITVRTYPSQSIVWAQLMKKELDLIFLTAPRNYKIVERLPDLKVHSFLSFYSYILAFNNRNELFKDNRVRHSINYAVNRKEIIQKLNSVLTEGNVTNLYITQWIIQ